MEGIMNVLTRLLLPVVAVALSLGCADASSPPGDGIALGTRLSAWVPDPSAALAHEYYSGFRDAAGLVIADSRSWEAAWARLYAGARPQPPLPAVDFRAERVVLVALGERNSGGYDIRIDSVARFQRGSVTYVTGTAPGHSCLKTGALTQPVDVIRLSRGVEPMAFQQRAVVRDCPSFHGPIQGTWGGENAGLIADDTSAHVHIGCTAGDTKHAIVADEQGRFDVPGLYNITLYPVARGPDHPARFTGLVDGHVMTLTVTLTDTAVTLGPVRLELGKEPRMGPCPICRKPTR
jgi:hypothetical protein